MHNVRITTILISIIVESVTKAVKLVQKRLQKIV